MQLASQDQSARYRYISTAAARDTDTDAFVELQVVGMGVMRLHTKIDGNRRIFKDNMGFLIGLA